MVMFLSCENFMANLLPEFESLIEGCSVRSTEPRTGVHRDSIVRLMVRVGTRCTALLDEKMVDLDSTRVELDELRSVVARSSAT
jgi:hypothetical protein